MPYALVCEKNGGFSVVVDGPEPLLQTLEAHWAQSAMDDQDSFCFTRVVANSCGVSMGVSSGLRIEGVFNRTDVTMRMVLNEVEAAGWVLTHVTGSDINTNYVFEQEK